MPERTGSARWEGSLPEGSGTVRFGSGAFEGKYSAASRFEDGDGTNPEELIAAAHAGCFSMAFAHALTGAGFTPDSVSTEAKVHIVRADGGFEINKIDLVTQAKVPGIDEAAFQEQAQAAKVGCPVSKALSAVEITLDATLV
jgi:lipoyl-dependent peroxiredoxin